MTDAEDQDIDERLGTLDSLTERVTRIVCVYFERNPVPIERIGDVITAVQTALLGDQSAMGGGRTRHR